jgi:hypothetical protein
VAFNRYGLPSRRRAAVRKISLTMFPAIGYQDNAAPYNLNNVLLHFDSCCTLLHAPRYVEPVDTAACAGVGPYHTSIDVYSFAIIMWELGTGQLAVKALGFHQPTYNNNEVGLAMMAGGRPPIETVLKRYGPGVADLIKDCWSLDRASRPTSTQVKVRKSI